MHTLGGTKYENAEFPSWTADRRTARSRRARRLQQCFRCDQGARRSQRNVLYTGAAGGRTLRGGRGRIAAFQGQSGAGQGRAEQEGKREGRALCATRAARCRARRVEVTKCAGT